MAKRRPNTAAAERAHLFALEYLKDRNGTAAAIRAGYGEKGAHVRASRLLKTPKVQAILDEAMARAAHATQVTVERTLKEIARVAYGDVRKLFNEDGTLRSVHELNEDEAAMIAGVETEQVRVEGEDEEDGEVVTRRKIKINSKLKALDQCMDVLDMSKSKKTGEGSVLRLGIHLSGGKRLR